MTDKTSLLGSHLARVAIPLRYGSVGMAIAEMENLLAAWPQVHTAQKLDAIKDEYSQLCTDWQDNMDVPVYKEIYQKLLQRVFVLYANLALYDKISNTQNLAAIHAEVRSQKAKLSIGQMRQELESFVADTAMLSLEQPHVREQKSRQLYAEHQNRINNLFNFLLTTNSWPASVGQDIEELLLSPAVDTNDQQILVSAITLSLLIQFDIVKFKTMIRVYRHGTDEAVRQRALVGWVLGMDEQWNKVYPEQRQMIEELLQSDTICRELTELQMQMVYCMGTERDATKIQQEIIPDILKNKPLHIKPEALEEEDIEEMIHPEEFDDKMQKMEESFGRMVDMQKQGSDVFFSGFSQMKRFDFFRDMSNWFVPFFIDHPQLQSFKAACDKHPFLRQIVANGEFCNSDKYSMALGFEKFVHAMPAEVLKTMDQGDVPLDMLNQGIKPTAERLRRSYLMDLYRFFRLYSYRSEYRNPFHVTDDHEMGECLFMDREVFRDTKIEPLKDDVVQLLRRRKMAESSRRLLDSYAESHRGLQYYLWIGDYEKAYECDSNNERAEAGYARQLFGNADYEKAEQLYDRLIAQCPEKMGYMLNKSVCLLYQKRYEESLQLLYRLNYEHPDDAAVMRILAWTLVCDHREQQADTFYQRLIKMEMMQADDYLNHGYCLWLQRKVKDAVDSFRKHLSLIDKKIYDVDYFDRQMLGERGIDPTEIQFMLDLVFS